MTTYAHIVDDKVINVIDWDGETEYQLDVGELILIPDGVISGIGWTYIGGEFTEPNDYYRDEI